MDEVLSIDAEKRTLTASREYFFAKYFDFFDTEDYVDADDFDEMINQTKRKFKNDEAVEFLIDYFNNRERSRNIGPLMGFFYEFTDEESIDASTTDIQVLFSKTDAARTLFSTVYTIADYWQLNTEKYPVAKEFILLVQMIMINDAFKNHTIDEILFSEFIKNWSEAIQYDTAFLSKFIFYYKNIAGSRFLMRKFMSELFSDKDAATQQVIAHQYAAVRLCARYCRENMHIIRDQRGKSSISVTVDYLKDVIALSSRVEEYRELYFNHGIGFFADVFAIADFDLLEQVFYNDKVQRIGDKFIDPEQRARFFWEVSSIPTPLMLPLQKYENLEEVREIVVAIASIADEVLRNGVFQYFLNDPRLDYNGEHSFLSVCLLEMNEIDFLRILIRTTRETSFFGIDDVNFYPMYLSVASALEQVVIQSPMKLDAFLEALHEEESLQVDDLMYLRRIVDENTLVPDGEEEAQVLNVIDRWLLELRTAVYKK